MREEVEELARVHEADEHDDNGDEYDVETVTRRSPVGGAVFASQTV